MTHTLEYFGGGEVMYYITLAITTILTDGGFCKSMFRIIGLLGVTWCTIQFVYTRDPKATFSWFAGFILLTTFVYSARINIKIRDNVSGFERVVEGVPWVWGKPAYLLNSFSVVLSKKMDQIFTQVPGGPGGPGDAGFSANYIPYYETGTVFASKLMSKARHFKITDPNSNGNLERFINQCVVFDALIGHKYTMKDLLNTEDVWNLAKTHASPVMGFSYKPAGISQRASIVTCREGSEKLQAEWDAQLAEAMGRYGKAFFPHRNADARATFMANLPKSYQLLTKIPQTAEKILQQSMMMNALTSAPNKKLSELGSPMNYATTKTLLQQRSNFAIAGEVARDTLPIIKVVLEALTFASFIFVFFIALIPGGFRIFKTYFEMLLSLQLWPLLYTILNFIMTLYGRWQTGGLIGESGINMTNSAAIAEINADIAAYAGYWSMLVPIFAYMITKGGVGSMVHAAGHIGNAFMQASSSAAQEVTSGNISLGNMQYGTQSILNTTAHKHDSGFMHKDNQMETLMDDGTGRVIQPNGQVVYRGGLGQSISQMGMKAGSQDHMSKMSSESLAHSESVMQSKQEEWSASQMHTAGQLVNNATAISESISSGKAYDTSDGNTVSRNLQNMSDFSSQLQNRFGLNASQANRVTAGLAVGKGSKGQQGLMNYISPNMGFDFSNSAERQAAYDDVMSLLEKYTITDSLDQTAQSMEKIHFGDNNSEEARLAQDVSSSYQESESLRESASKAQQYHDSMSNLSQSVRSGSLNVEWDENQNILDHVANQTNQGHRIGHDTAYKMIARRDPIAVASINDYQNKQWERMESAIQLSDHVLSPEEITTLYNNSSHYDEAGPQENRDIKAMHTKESEQIKQSSGLTEGKVSDQPKQDHGIISKRVDRDMDKGQMEMESKRQTSRDASHKHTDRSITEESIRNTWGGIDRDV